MALWPPFSPLPGLYFSKPLLVTFTPNPTNSLNEIQSNKAPDFEDSMFVLVSLFPKNHFTHTK